MKRIIALAFAALLITACSDTSNRTLKEYFSAFLNENTEIIAFGSTELKSILDKTDYSKEELVNAFLGDYLKSLEGSVHLEKPIYYAIEGPLDDEKPKATYLFLEVKDKEKLKENLTKNGFDFSEDGDIEYCADGDVAIGIENNLVVVVIKNEDYDPKKVLATVFEKTKNELSEGRIDEILNQKGDIVLGMNIENLYATSNTDLENLSADKQKELQTMLKDSYIQNSVRFEDGAIIIETKNYFSDALKKKLFLKSDASAPVLAKLGQGEPRMGLAFNLDMKKAQRFMDEFSPEALESLSEDLGGPFSLALMASGNDLSKLFDGNFGFVMMGDPTNMKGGFTPDVNFHVGFGPLGSSLGSTLKELFQGGFAQIDVDTKGISGFTSLSYASTNGRSINIPQGCEDFGKNAVTAFVNLEGLDMSSFELEGEAKLIELVKYVNVSYGLEGGKITIMAKNGKENALKQVLQKIMSELESQFAA